MKWELIGYIVLGGSATLSAVDAFSLTLEVGQSMIVYIKNTANRLDIEQASIAIGVTLQPDTPFGGFAKVIAP